MATCPLPTSLQPYLEILSDIFASHQVVLAYLFGSQAEGEARRSSDIDLAVLLNPAMPRERWFDVHLSLAGTVCDALGRNDVDVVVLNQATALLCMEIVRHGQIIYEDPVTQPGVDFASQTIVQFADTEHFRRINRQYFEERINARRKAGRNIHRPSTQLERAV